MNKKEQNLVILNYNGIIQESTTKILLNSITYKLQDKTTRGILISTKGVPDCENIHPLKALVKQLDTLSKQENISIAFIDYSIELFEVFKIATKYSKIKLFQNFKAAQLFLDPKSFKQDLYVLVYDEDDANAKRLANKLSTYDYKVIRSKNSREFQKYVDEKKHDILITHCALNMENANTKQVLTLSKKLISHLPIFMDTAVDTLVSFTSLNAEKKSHSIKRFDPKLGKNTICAVMQFTGEIDGFFTLVFPKNIAAIAMESLLGETVEESDTDSLKDGIAELCNIITGSTKTVLSNKNVKVLFELPKTYLTLELVNRAIGKNPGIWIDMQLEGKPFYMFITK